MANLLGFARSVETVSKAMENAGYTDMRKFLVDTSQVFEAAEEAQTKRDREASRQTLQVIKIDQGMGPRFYTHCRTKAGEKVVLNVEGHLPFFYAEDGPAGHREVLKADAGYTGINGHQLWKYTVTNPRVVRDLRPLFDNPHEADVPYTQRVLIDHPFNGVIEAPVAGRMTNVKLEDIKFVEVRKAAGFVKAWFDIETGEGAIDDLEKGEAPQSPIYVVGVKHEKEWHCWVWHPLAAQLRADGYLPEVLQVPSKKPGSTDVFDVNIHAYGDERSMMQSFVQWLRITSPDTIAGWNSGFFDAPYLIRRGERIGIRGWDWGFGITNSYEGSLPGTHQVDLLAVHRKQSRGVLPSNTLQAIAKHVCGIELEKVPGKIQENWEKDLLALIRYNTWDVEATWRIDQAKKYTDWAVNYAFFSGVDNVMDVVKASVVSDVMLNRKAHHKHKLVLPQKPEMEEKDKWSKRKQNKEKDFKGAQVRDPVPGIHPNIAVVDFSGMYPTIVIGGNISYETYCAPAPDKVCARPHIKVPDVGHLFHTDTLGLVPDVMIEAFELRRVYDVKYREAVDKDEKEFWKEQRKPIKEFMNACGFGVQGYKGFRLYRKEVAESITAFGRTLGREVADFIASKGYLVIGGDTDSVMFQVRPGEPLSPEEAMRVLPPLVEEINVHIRMKASQWGMTNPDQLNVGWEKFASWWLQGEEKKRYACNLVIEDGKILPDPRLVIVGFENKRSETPALTVKLQETVFKMVLQEGKSADVVYDYVQGIYRSIRDGRVDPRDAAFRPRLGMDLEDYKTKNQTVQAVEYSQEWLGMKFRREDRVVIVPVRTVPPNKPKTDIIGLTETAQMPTGYVPDWTAMADKAVKGKVVSVFELLGIEPRIEALGMATLTDYFR